MRKPCKPALSRREANIDADLALGHGAQRADRVLAVAVRNVELHGWEPSVTEDHCRLRLSGGSVSLDVGRSAELLSHIDAGAR